MKKKILATALVLLLVVCCAVGGTVAWLTSQSGTVRNTFTVGDISVDIEETGADENGEKEYTLVPGVALSKDPKVIVQPESEACWLFVQVVEKNWPTVTESDGSTLKVDYDIRSGWIPLGTAYPGVYYMEIDAATAKAGDTYYVLAGNGEYPNGVVTVSGTLTKEEMQAITTIPTLTFKAFAVQRENVADAVTAWGYVPASEKLS